MSLSFDESLKILRGSEALHEGEEKKIRANHEYFESKRDEIVAAPQKTWAGALNGRLYFGRSLKDMERMFDAMPDGDYAYIEQIV